MSTQKPNLMLYADKNLHVFWWTWYLRQNFVNL